MAVKKLFHLYDEAGNLANLYAEDVFDKTSGKTLAEHIAEAPTTESVNGLIDTAIQALKTGDIATLQNSLSSLQTIVNNFLTGEPDDGTIDRLSELVNAINANKDSIDALVADHVKKTEIINDLTTGGTDKVLSAEQGKALKALIDNLTGSSHSHIQIKLFLMVSVKMDLLEIYNLMVKNLLVKQELLLEHR